VAELKAAPIVLAAVELVLVLAEAQLGRGPVAVARALVLVVVVPVLGRVVAVLELVLEEAPLQDQARRPVPAEVAPIRSVIAAYLQVQLHAAAASVVAAETLLAPAVAAAALA
jgi:hypothetical protein